MNILKKLYCRTFQISFRLIMPILPYRKPETIGSVKKLPALIKKNGCNRILIVTDECVVKLGLTKRLEKALSHNNIKYFIYDKTVANPTTKNVEDALHLYRINNCDGIIGFGGGSNMDCAKVLAARVAKPEQSISEMKGVLKIHKRLPLLIAIPTTAGTGSEATLAAVIVDSETRHKYAINDFSLIPKYAVLDPKNTVTLPPSITATTGMDALTHAVEAFIGRSTTKQTRKQAFLATKLIFENIDIAYNDGSNIEARQNMLKAAYYAGCAFTKSYVGYIHAVSHSLSGEYNIAHGLANAIILPYVLDSYGETIYTKLRVLAIAAGLATKETPVDEAARAFIKAIKEMNKRFNIPDQINEIIEDDIPRLAKLADKEANPLYPVPVLMNAEELENFYYSLID